jgi:predicted permease
MRALLTLRRVWMNVVRRRRVERDLDDELQAMVDLLASEKVSRGVDPERARREALIDIGGVTQVKEQVRQARAGATVETLGQDVRYAVKLLRRNPLFAATAVLSLAIGIGATTSIFTVANGLLMRPSAGVGDPSTLVDIVQSERTWDGPGVRDFSYPTYLDVRRRLAPDIDAYAYDLQPRSMSLRDEGAGGVERVFVGLVSGNYFRALEVRAERGRPLAPEDEREGSAPAAVLNHRLWNRRFNGDPQVIGRTVVLNAQPFTIVGVAAAGFEGVSVVAPDLWIPLSFGGSLIPGGEKVLTDRGAGWLLIGGRLAASFSRRDANDRIRAVGASLAREFPNAYYGPPSEAPSEMVWSAETASPIPHGLRIIAAGFLALLMALVSIVLVIACANVAGVLLARATVRRREIAVRAAIGAGRRRLVRQLLTESVVLFTTASVVGLGLARLMTAGLVALLPAFPVPVHLSVALDSRVVLFALALSFVAALLSGLAPALHASRADVVSALKDDAQGPSDRLRLRSAFVVAQVACSILLIVTAGLFVRGFNQRTSLDRGFESADVDIATVDLTMAGYTEGNGRDAATALVEHVRGMPGVTHATLANRVPDSAGLSLGQIVVPGVEPPRGEPAFRMNWTIVDRDYFSTLRIPLVIGREFLDSDGPTALPVAIVGKTAASRFWPGKDPLGQFIVAKSADRSTRLTVVGVVEDLRWGNAGDRDRLNLYVPFRQRYVPGLTILARNDGRGSIAEQMRQQVMAKEGDLPVMSAQPLDDSRNSPVETQLRYAGTVAGGVGAVGVILAAMGIYGVTAFAVARRTREIGIRLSLGAGRVEVIGMVLRHGMSLVAVGCAIGLGLALAASRVFASQRFGAVTPDPWTYAGAVTLFAAVGLIACYVPVRRASRIDAMTALRYE